MGKFIPNPLMPRVTGTIDNLVFRDVNGTTIVSKKPDMSNAVENPSIRQLEQREKFAKAHAYAQKINRDPQLKAAYAAKVPKGRTVYNTAIKEYYKLNPSK